jgi:radical SAM superfamily enzyme YgiQ (UPF0313 family)
MKILFVRPQPSPDTIGLQHIMIVEPLELEVMAALTAADDECMIADMILEKQPIEKIISDFKPGLFCITGYITHMQVIKEYCRLAKSLLPSVHTVAGGVHIEKFPEDADDPSVDFRVVRNATRSFPGLLNHLKYDTPLPQGILRNGELLQAAKLPPYDFYFPLPRRELTEQYRSKYFYVFHQKVALLKTSFGCPYTCRFCFCRKITDDHYFARPLEDVIAELKQIKEKEVYIVDDDFLLSAQRLQEFIRRVKQEHIQKKYLVYGRADFIAAHPRFIKQLHAVGLRTVIVGIESFSDQELASFEKRTTADINELALRVLKESGVDCYAAVITSPEWSEDDFNAAGKKLLKMGIKFVNLQPLTPLKGTGIEVADENLVISREDYPRWDLAHVAIKPVKMSVSHYYTQLMHLYERIMFHPKNLFSHFIHYPLYMQWKLAKGIYRVHKQYKERIKNTKTIHAENPVYTTNAV